MEAFENTDTPTYDQTVAAYVDRDDSMHLELTHERFLRHVKKLGYSINTDDIQQEYQNYIRHKIMKAMDEGDDSALLELNNLTYDDYYNEKYPLKSAKYANIRTALDTQDKEIYYRAFTLEELKCLGY